MSAAAPRRRQTVSPPSGAGGGTDDHDGTGTDSTQVGTGADASGSQATAVGDYAYVDTVPNGTAYGYAASVYGDDGTAIGANSGVNTDGTAVGSSSGASPGGTAVGARASASDDGVAVGTDSIAGTQTTVAGQNAHTTGTANRSVIYGRNATTSAVDSTVIGDSASNTGARGMAIGKGATNTVADRATMKINDLWLVPSGGSGINSIVMRCADGATDWHLAFGINGELQTDDGAGTPGLSTVILMSGDGTRWQQFIDNSGVTSWAVV